MNCLATVRNTKVAVDETELLLTFSLLTEQQIYILEFTKKFGYRFADLQNQSRTSNLDNEHFPRDASNHANVEEATGPPYEDLSNGLYLRQQTIYSGQTQLQVENNTEGMETQMNTCMLFSSSKIYILYISSEKEPLIN